MKKTIALLPGDGVGPEVTAEAVKVLKKIAKKFGHEFTFNEGVIGATAVDKKMKPLPDETIDLCLQSDAVLLGTIGDPRKYDDQFILSSLLDIRKRLGLFANIRPIFTFSSLYHASPLKKEVIEGTDFVVVRELTGGIYFGEKSRSKDGNTAFDTCAYSKEEIIRVGKVAFQLALKRKRKITVVDKANVLETSKLWRETIQEQSKQYTSVTIDFMLVDNASMQIIKHPRDFDVILTENMFGDILTDEASVIAGSIGLLPSASIGTSVSLFEPIHGSFPRAAGKNIANPIGAILSAGLMLEYSFGLTTESKTIFEAVKKALGAGFGTKDIMSTTPLHTDTLGDKISKFV